MRGHLNVLKGAYLTTQQSDKVAKPKAGIVINRGQLLFLDANGQFDLAVDPASTQIVYVSLNETGTPDVMFADAVAGLSLEAPLEIETTEFDTTQTYAIGDKLTLGANGKVTKATGSDRVVGRVTKAVYSRWINSKIVGSGFAATSGARGSVITYATASK